MPPTSITNFVCGLTFSRSQPGFEGFLPHQNQLMPVHGMTKARFTQQFFWHGTCLNLAPVPKIFGPAPSIFVV